jgi:hypothetical protein
MEELDEPTDAHVDNALRKTLTSRLQTGSLRRNMMSGKITSLKNQPTSLLQTGSLRRNMMSGKITSLKNQPKSLLMMMKMHPSSRMRWGFTRPRR